MKEINEECCDNPLRTYQAPEEENGIKESYYCDRCNKELELPEIEWNKLVEED